MNVNFSEAIRDIHGDPITVKRGSVESPMTLAHVACEALLALDPEESGESKASSYRLAMRLVGKGRQDVSAEDVVLLKRKIGVLYAPIVVGRAFELLDPQTPLTVAA